MLQTLGWMMHHSCDLTGPTTCRSKRTAWVCCFEGGANEACVVRPHAILWQGMTERHAASDWYYSYHACTANATADDAARMKTVRETRRALTGARTVSEPRMHERRHRWHQALQLRVGELGAEEVQHARVRARHCDVSPKQLTGRLRTERSRE